MSGVTHMHDVFAALFLNSVGPAHRVFKIRAPGAMSAPSPN